MKRIKVPLLLLVLFLSTFSMNASSAEASLVSETQQTNSWKISGTVTDKDGEPLIGASVTVKGQNKGVITDLDGHYSIDVSAGDMLVFKYISFVTQEIKITSQKNLNVKMSEELNVLNEVAVTALGIKREKKALGYSMGEVKGDELDKAKETNVINSLAGKVPGLVVSQTAGGPSGSTRVIIRGSTELTGNNQPLYVVDGIPLDNTNYGSAGQWGGYDLGDGISSINPDDIENISVLKGPAASALYGSRASHGVILITTKKAASLKRIGIEFNSSTTLETQLTKYNNIQTLYGQGTEGRIRGDDDKHSSNKSWGPKIDEGLYLTYFDGVQRPYKVIENNIDGFFRTGVTTTNTLILNSVQNDTGVRLSYTNMYNSDIVPKTDMSRNTVTLRANTKFAKKLDLDGKVNYVREDVNNRPALSHHRANPANNLITLANTFDQKWLKDSYKTADGDYYDWNNRDVWNLNPYWVINEMNNKSNKDQIMASGVLRYTFNDKFQAQLTGGGEISMFNFQEFAPPTSPGYELGYLQKSSYNNHTFNAELLLMYKDKTGDFDYGATVGGNIFNVNNKIEVTTAKDMKMRETVALQSFLQKEITENSYRKQINSAFGMVNLGYKNFLYLDATLRVDKSSTLPSSNNTYIYPSVSSSFVFTEVLNISDKILPYGKLRASYAQVGSDTDPFQLGLVYAMTDKTYGSYAISTIYNNVIPNKDLKPTKTNSYEVGFDLRFFKNRVSLDATYYNQRSKNQIMRLNTSVSSGYTSKIVNAGEIENKGVEIALGARIIETKDFSWDLNLNFSKNINKVKKLADGIDNFELESAAWLNVKVAAVEGENYGSIMGYDFKRNDAGSIIINGVTGLPERTDELQVLGNATWDWTGGISTNINYKNFALSGIIDVKVGADLFTMTAMKYYLSGKAKETLPGRDEWYISEEKRLEAGVLPANWVPTGGYVAEGVIETIDANGNKTYKENSIAVDPEKYWQHVGTNIATPFIKDNTYVKMREIMLTYRVPSKWITKFAESMSFSLFARNPFIIYKNVDNIDPDSNYNNGGGMGLEYGSLPSRRSFGFNLNVKF